MSISSVGNNSLIVQQSYFKPRNTDLNSKFTQQANAQGPSLGQTEVTQKQTAEQQRIQQQVQQLKAQEEKVKAHEAAHKAAGGQYASSATYSYRPGPDGRSYIVAGEVQIDMSPGQTPQETIAKMQIVQQAAMAPADPSGQDRAVAAEAAAISAQAQQEQMQQANTEQAPGAEKKGSPGTGGTKPSSADGVATTAAGADNTSSTKVVSSSAKADEGITKVNADQQKSDSSQLTAYKANTTPGDIFVTQKMSTYA